MSPPKLPRSGVPPPEYTSCRYRIAGPTMAVACALRRALGAGTHTQLRSLSHLPFYRQNRYLFLSPTWTHNVALCREATFSRRSLSTQSFPSSKSSRARIMSARELYAQRNRSLVMYTSAVVRPSLRAALYQKCVLN